MRTKIVLLNHLADNVSRLWWISGALNTRRWLDATNALMMAILAFRTDAEKMEPADKESMLSACSNANAILDKATRGWWYS